jgi:hypothetical protein
MKLIIDIPEELYYNIMDMDFDYMSPRCLSPRSFNELINAVKGGATIIEADVPKRRKGTPLEENDSGYNCENWIP